MKARTQVGLAVLLLVACRPSATSDPTTPAPSEPQAFVEAPPPAGPEFVEDPPVPRLSPGTCPPEVSDVPEPYFGPRVLFRPPKPVSSADLVEVSPERAQLVAPAMVQTCVVERPTVALERLILELRDPDPGVQLELLRNEVLSSHGLLDQATLIEAEADAQRRTGEWVFEVRSNKLLVTIESGNRMLVVAIYEVAAADWSLVVNSLRESSRRISTSVP